MRPGGFIISALSGGGGKTLVSVGLCAAFRARGKNVLPFKKGPDYIDAGWLSLSTGNPCFNLDTFMMSPETVRDSYLRRSASADLTIIEGNRGLFDGIDLDGRTSTAELSKLVETPVIMCMDCTKTTRTMAAVLMGCQRFDPDITIAGVILNRVAGSRHEGNLRKNIEHYCHLPVIGAIPKLDSRHFPERHMGLVPTFEHEWAVASVEAAAEMAAKYLDLAKIEKIASALPPASDSGSKPDGSFPTHPLPVQTGRKPVIGVIRDASFQFYYPENLEALKAEGAELVCFSPLTRKELPEIDALYIGGGFPETHARALSENSAMRRSIREKAEQGMPVYAECGGLMYLGKSLHLDHREYPMCGVLPITFGFSKKPVGHGYTIAEVSGENPYYPAGTELRGHEFHYSSVLSYEGEDTDFAFTMKRGKGIIDRKDGLIRRRVLATYTHIHALGTPAWAKSLVSLASAHPGDGQNDIDADATSAELKTAITP